jgi:hypothetical protein
MKHLRNAWATLFAILREIFDEASYMRFLQRHRLSSSTASYAAFVQEREQSHARRPKCC